MILALILAVLIVLALWELSYHFKIKRRHKRLEDAQRYGKPNWTKWWGR